MKKSTSRKKPSVEKKPAAAKKPAVLNKARRRPLHSKPCLVACLTDKTVVSKFEATVRNVKALHHCATWETKKERDDLPLTQHFMCTHDQVAEKPCCAKHGQTKQKKPVAIFCIPEGVNKTSPGERSITVGRAMLGHITSDDFKLTTDQEACVHLAFDEKMELVKKQKQTAQSSMNGHQSAILLVHSVVVSHTSA